MIRLFLKQIESLRHAFVLLTVVLYAVAGDLHAGCSTAFVVADALMFSLLTICMALTVWNILRFTLKTLVESGRLSAMLVTMGAIWCLVGIGVEGTMFILLSEEMFQVFSSMLLPRVAVMILLFLVAEQNVERVLLVDRLNAEGDVDETPLSSGVENLKTLDESEKTCAKLTQINVKSGQRLDIINVEDIIYLQADGDYVSIVTAQGRFLKEQTMKYFEENLPSEMFARVHRSYIVRLQAISRIEKYGQMQQLELCNREKIRVSPSGYRVLKERLKL